MDGRDAGFRRGVDLAGPIAGFLLGLLSMSPLVAPAHAVHVDGDRIVITQEDLDAMARSRETSRSVGAAAPAARPGEDEYPVHFEACYAYPAREFILWDWFESGALGVIAEVEGRLVRRREEYERAAGSSNWSEQLQREIDRIEDEIDALEHEREQTLLERVATLEATPAPSPARKAELAVLHMAFALISLEDGRAKDALGALDRAAKNLPGEPLVELLRAIALRELGRADAAREALRAALQRDSRLVLACLTLAEAYEDALEYSDAAELWEQAGRARIGFPAGLERWADRNRDRFAEGAASLRGVWADYLRLRLRLARLRDFAHRYFQSFDKAAYTMVYDPSIGLPADEEFLAPLRSIVGRYLTEGEAAVDRSEVERLLERMRAERDEEAFGRLMRNLSNFVATAERRIGRAIGHRPTRRPVVVLYNPNVWEAMIARRSALAFYKPHARSISIYLEPHIAPVEIKNTIYHEYGHFVTFDLAGPRGMPIWLAEGLAEFLALESEYDRFREDPILARWREIWTQERVGRPWFAKSQEEFGVADYYKARRAVGLLAARFGTDGLNEFLSTLGGGEDLDGAAQKAFGMTYRNLLRFLVTRLPGWEGPGN